MVVGVRARLLDSIRQRMRADVPVGIDTLVLLGTQVPVDASTAEIEALGIVVGMSLDGSMVLQFGEGARLTLDGVESFL